MRDLHAYFVSVVAACVGEGCGAERAPAQDGAAASVDHGEDTRDDAAAGEESGPMDVSDVPLDSVTPNDATTRDADAAADADALGSAGDDAIDAGCDPEYVTFPSCFGDAVSVRRYRCGLPPDLPPGEYSFDRRCEQHCPLIGVGALPVRCVAAAETATAPATVTCTHACPIDGRRPEGYAHPPPDPAHDAAQAWLAASASFEHASVTAFIHLARELQAHGAPSDLVARARGAAADEVRHTAAKCELARRRGLSIALPEVDAPPLRDLAALARENAAEGCVRETWGALFATWQGAHAVDPTARAVLAAIALDESRHAELAWEVDAWARTRLTGEEVQAVDAARAEAVAALGRGPLGAHDRALRADYGAPDPSEASRLFEAARGALWR